MSEPGSGLPLSEATFDYLSLNDLLEIADVVLPVVEVRDLGLLSSAAARPQASAFGEDAYQTVHEKAAALLHSLGRNHALIDGNKRLAYEATRLFLQLNGRDITATTDEKEALVLLVATGGIDVVGIAGWLTAHTRTY